MKLYQSITVAVIVAVAVGTAACQSQDQAHSAEGAALSQAPMIRATLDTMDTALQTALNSGEFERASTLYSEEAAYYPPTGAPAEGREAIRAVLEQRTPMDADVSIKSREVRVLSPEWASEYGTMVVGSGEGGVPYASLYRKTDAGWKIYRRTLAADNGGEGSL